MARKKKKKLAPASAPIVTAVVCPPDSVHPTAFMLGFHHGYERCPALAPRSFAYQSTASAYALGYTAGRAARDDAKGSE